MKIDMKSEKYTETIFNLCIAIDSFKKNTFLFYFQILLYFN